MEKIKDAIDHGKTVKEEYVKKVCVKALDINITDKFRATKLLCFIKCAKTITENETKICLIKLRALEIKLMQLQAYNLNNYFCAKKKYIF